MSLDSGSFEPFSGGAGGAPRQNIPGASDARNVSGDGQRGAAGNKSSKQGASRGASGGSFVEDDWFGGAFDDIDVDLSPPDRASAAPVQFTGWGDDGSAGKPLTHKPGQGAGSRARASGASDAELFNGTPSPEWLLMRFLLQACSKASLFYGCCSLFLFRFYHLHWHA